MSTDVGGPVYPLGPNREKYYVTFTYVRSRYSFVIPIKKKAQVFQEIIAALTYARHVRKVALTIVHSDNSKEYVAKATVEAARQFGATTRIATPYNPEENGIWERLSRTIMDGVRCALNTSKMAEEYWPLALDDLTFKKILFIHE